MSEIKCFKVITCVTVLINLISNCDLSVTIARKSGNFYKCKMAIIPNLQAFLKLKM